MMKSRNFLVLSTTILLASAALAHAASDQPLSATDKTFMTTAARGSVYELQLSKVAQSKAQDQKVRQYADMIVSDHSTADKEFQQLAQQDNVDLPTTLSQHDKTELDKVSSASGPAFDTMYLKQMKLINQEDISSEKQEISTTNDSRLKQFVETMRNGDQKHNRIAEKLSQGK